MVFFLPLNSFQALCLEGNRRNLIKVEFCGNSEVEKEQIVDELVLEKPGKGTWYQQMQTVNAKCFLNKKDLKNRW